MGKAGRVACIFTPWALTIASFICLILIEIAGWSKGELNSYYFFQADFTNLTVSSASTLENTTALTLALEEAKANNELASVYQIHLWNYCSANSSIGTIDFCSDRHSNYYFNPVEVWGLNATATTSGAASTSTDSNIIESEISSVENNTKALENKVLGKSGREALDAYEHVAKWMFIAYEVSFYTTLATIICGLLAIWSRIGSFLTWYVSLGAPYCPPVHNGALVLWRRLRRRMASLSSCFSMLSNVCRWLTSDVGRLRGAHEAVSQ